MNERAHLLGGTDAASLIGLGRISPLMLYLRLKGDLVDDFEGNEATDAGRLFEDRVAVDLIRNRLGIDLVRPKQMTMALPDEPRIGASFDFAVAEKQPVSSIGRVDTMRLVEGKDLAEIKLTGSRAMWGDLDKVPVHVGAQVQMQMAVARAAGRVVPCVHVIAMFVPGFTMEPFPVEEDQEVGGALLDAARTMIRRVDAGEPPTPGDEADARALYLGRRGQTHICTPEQVAQIEQLRELKQAEKLCAEQMKQLRDSLIPAFGEATEIVHPTTGEVLATYRPNRTFDEVAFAAACPEGYRRALVFQKSKLPKEYESVAKEFMREPTSPLSSVRPFKLKGE